eukprot:PhM_4_TR3380/c0_g1_i3/m.10673
MRPSNAVNVAAAPTSNSAAAAARSHLFMFLLGVLCAVIFLLLAEPCALLLGTGHGDNKSNAAEEELQSSSPQHQKRRSLCLFVHADNSSGLSPNRPYADELDAMLGTWADDNTFIYTYGDLSVPDGSAHVVHMNRSKWGPHFAAAYRAAYPGTPEEQLWKNEKTFPMWMHVRANIDNPALFARCAWFMRVDTDTYVNTDRVEAFLSAWDPAQHHYAGSMGLYPAQDFYFGSGGTGYVLSHALFRSVNFTQCWADIATGALQRPALFEDVEVMWCLRRHRADTFVIHDFISMLYDNGYPSAVDWFLETKSLCTQCFMSWHKVLPHDMYRVHDHVKKRAYRVGSRRSRNVTCNALGGMCYISRTDVGLYQRVKDI